MTAAEPSEQVWATGVASESRHLFPTSRGVSVHVLEVDRDGLVKRCRVAAPEHTRSAAEASIARGRGACPPGLSTMRLPEIVGHEGASAVALVARPVAGIVTSISAVFDETPVLGRHERHVLLQLTLHLDAAHRLRLLPDAVCAVLTADGRLVPPGPITSALDRERFAAEPVTRARARPREEGDLLALWSALLDGRVSLVPRAVHAAAVQTEYLVLQNRADTLGSTGFRALNTTEASVLRFASQGMSNKLVAYGLGISEAAVSTSLANAAAKIGLGSRAELVRVAAMLVKDEQREMPDAALTDAEREILELLQQGLSNREIADRRARSVRTIANQVAALLRKTGSGSRRELSVRAASSRPRAR